MKLVTKRGESKEGLSMHYIQLRYSGRVFIDMLKRVKEFPFVSLENKKGVEENIEDLLGEWDDIQSFFIWEYSNRHLKLIDEEISHCSNDVVGMVRFHVDKENSCEKCTQNQPYGMGNGHRSNSSPVWM